MGGDRKNSKGKRKKGGRLKGRGRWHKENFWKRYEKSRARKRAEGVDG